ncbi:MAG: DNA polymerase III subunit gamma/tau [Christensenellaceae bacterium]|jgi:DNA polymerase-3 subunit gamma/tau
MAYQALYRAFRPRRFSDVSGQETIVTILRNQVKNNAPSHAYLFAGPRGTGKTSTAKILAAALNCLDPQEGEPCLVCENCKAALQDNMLDIIEMDAASNNGVDNARDIRDKAGLLPTNGAYKVYIIDEVHMLTGQAFNALLKTLEEPPSHVVFILATTELDALPKTVLSRCQRFDFRLIEKEGIVARLKNVVAEIGASADDDALYAIAEAADGALRDALTVLEKCVSMEVHITEALVATILGHAQKTAVYELLAALSRYDGKTALLTLEQVLDSGVEASTLLRQLLDGYEEMLYALVAGREVEETLQVCADRLQEAGLLRGIEVLQNAAGHMRYAPRQTILLESAILRLLLPESETDYIAFEERIQKLEQAMEHGVTIAAAEQVREAPQATQEVKSEAREKKPKEREKGAQKEMLPEDNEEETGDAVMWSWALEAYAEEASAAPILEGMRLVKEAENVIQLRAATPITRLLFENGAIKKDMQEKLEQQFGKKIVFEVLSETKEAPMMQVLGDIEIID